LNSAYQPHALRRCVATLDLQGGENTKRFKHL